MSKMIQIRNVPDALHRSLKARADGRNVALGLSVSGGSGSRRATNVDRVAGALHKREPVGVQLDTAHLVQKEREAR
jgi:antitoxin FitA